MPQSLASPRPAPYAPRVPRGLFPCAIVAALAAAMGCSPPTDTTTGGSGPGGGDAGADCPNGPVAMLILDIKAAGGPVPMDTTLAVSWSAGAEPSFTLDDPKTWSTLDDANLVCDVDPQQPPPTDLVELWCQLWTSGVTHVKVTAHGYAPYESMLKPKYSTACKGPVPTTVKVTLAPLPDAGAGGAP